MLPPMPDRNREEHSYLVIVTHFKEQERERIDVQLTSGGASAPPRPPLPPASRT